MLKQPTCRCCLAVDGKLIFIHEEGTAQLYTDTVGLPVQPSDSYPQHVCVLCLQSLQKFARFRSRCHKALDTFRQTMLQDSTVTNVYTDPTTSNNAELKPKFDQTKVKTIDVFSENIDDSNDNPLDFLEIPEVKVEKEENKDLIEEGDRRVVVEQFIEPKDENSSDSIHSDLYINESDVSSSDGNKKKNVKIKNKRKKVKSIKNSKCKRQRVSKSDKKVMIDFADSIGFDLTELSLDEQLKEIEEKKKESSKELICEQCGKHFNNLNCLKRHKKCHIMTPDSFMCDLCSWVFQRKSLLIEHILDHRYIFKCKTCDFKTKKSVTLKAHHEFHKGKRFPCKYCDKVFEKLSSCFTHVRFKHESELPWCRICGEAFISDKGVASHKKLSHNKFEQFPYVCQCDKRFGSENALQRHLILKGCDLPNCVHCGEAFPNDQLLKHHLIQRHIDGAVPSTFDCKNCAFRFYNHDALVRHSCVAAAACAQCGMSFENTQQLIEHVARNHHIFKCEECSRQFTSKHFKIHYMLKHSGVTRTLSRGRRQKLTSGQLENRVRKWRVVDGETIKQVETQPRVERPPEGEMTHICEVCGKGFLNSTKLSIHKCRVHGPARAFACDRCHKTFKTRVALDIHMRVHTGERPYKCSECPKAFKHRGAYTRHYLIHSGQRNHVCTMCEKTFQTSTGVKMHIQTAHMKMPWPTKHRRRHHDGLINE